MNLTIIHAGGDAVTISGRIYIEHENGTSNNPEAYLIHGDKTIPIIKGQFEIPSFRFGEHLQVSINLTGTSSGVIRCILYSKTQILAEVTQKIETSC